MELVLPQNYVEIEQEEMMYLDGGVYVSKQTARSVLAAIGINPGSYMLAAASWVSKRFGGAFGWIAWAVLGVLGAQVIAFGRALAYTALYGGRDISWSWNPLKFGVQY